MRAARLALAAASAALMAVPFGAAAGHAATGTAPGAPGSTATWTPADKSGFGTAYGAPDSKVWFTVGAHGGLTEVYYPDLGTPSARSLEFVVADGTTAVRAGQAGTSQTDVVDDAGLTYTHVDATSGSRLTTRYVTDPARSTVLVDVDFTSLDGRERQLYALYDPALTNDGSDDTGATVGRALTAGDGHTASALRAAPAFAATSSGYAGTSDGWTDLSADGRMDWQYAAASTPSPRSPDRSGR